MSDQALDALDRARQRTGMSPYELWLRYFGLGGMRPELEVEAITFGLLAPTDLDRNRIVHALNERFSELGRNHPVPYAQHSGPPDER